MRQLHPGKEIVALHNRRGDNLPANSNYDTKEGGSFRTNKEDFHPLLSEEYLHKSREEFDNCVFLVFSDNNQNPEKRIVAPKEWFGKAYAHYNMSDLIPSTWKTI